MLIITYIWSAEGFKITLMLISFRRIFKLGTMIQSNFEATGMHNISKPYLLFLRTHTVP